MVNYHIVAWLYHDIPWNHIPLKPIHSHDIPMSKIYPIFRQISNLHRLLPQKLKRRRRVPSSATVETRENHKFRILPWEFGEFNGLSENWSVFNEQTCQVVAVSAKKKYNPKWEDPKRRGFHSPKTGPGDTESPPFFMVDLPGPAMKHGRPCRGRVLNMVTKT